MEQFNLHDYFLPKDQLKSMKKNWQPGSTPIAVVMISLNEGHNMRAVLQNLKDWAQEVFLVDSFSTDNTVVGCLKMVF